MATSDKTTKAILAILHHEHEHFERAMSDLKESFRAIVTHQKSLIEEPGLLETAMEDLDFFISEMTEHFSHEESEIFPIITKLRANYEDEVGGLLEAHDQISAELVALEGMVRQDPKVVQDIAFKVYDRLNRLLAMIDQHGDDEAQLFENMTEVLNEDERDLLLQELSAV